MVNITNKRPAKRRCSLRLSSTTALPVPVMLEIINCPTLRAQ